MAAEGRAAGPHIDCDIEDSAAQHRHQLPL
jgi:hypothetical protein